MKYSGMPAGMWALFGRSFRKQLTGVLKISEKEAAAISGRAKRKYRQIIEHLPEFETDDRFKMNIVSCAMLCGFLLSLPERPTVEQATAYYKAAMMTGPMVLFCQLSGKNKYTPKDLAGMRKTAALRAADRNPYSWNMEFLPYPDGTGYEARFTACGICHLMTELGLSELIPAMCRLDYTMAEAGGVTDFVRKYTLAEGGPYCDCGYIQRKK